MEILRRHTDYALRAALCLAASDEQGQMSVRRISEQTDIPYPITCKLMQKLSQAGIAAGILGLHGGYALSRPPSDISVFDIIQAVQGPLQMNKCTNPSTPCPKQPDCAVHPFLAEIQNELDNRLQKTTLKDLLTGGFRPQSRR